MNWVILPAPVEFYMHIYFPDFYNLNSFAIFLLSNLLGSPHFFYSEYLKLLIS